MLGISHPAGDRRERETWVKAIQDSPRKGLKEAVAEADAAVKQEIRVRAMCAMCVMCVMCVVCARVFCFLMF